MIPGVMRDPIHQAGKIFVMITVVGFFLPWVRISPDSLKGNTMEVVSSLAEGGQNLGSTFVWMRWEEWKEVWADPADGFSGFQLAFGAKSGTPRAKAQQELASVSLDGKDKRPLLGWLLLIPVLTLLATAGLFLRQVPAAFLILTAGGLGALYAILRWRIATAYTDRLLAQLELGPGWWLTVYGMLGLGVVCMVLGIRRRGGD
ncbi:MAG: hypothetical protein EBT50_02660 [Verrucomicrobia bacterium]|nr:hypothetical protein [Verrucomicrobiota bacterium]